MQALILAAGRGERLRPLTDRLPKPLIEVGGVALIDHHLHRLRRAGVRDCVINTAHLGHLIEAHVGDGTRYGLIVRYSREPLGAFDTGGGVRHAMKLMRPERFLTVNADVWTDFDPTWMLVTNPCSLAHLILVPNPADHRLGDFGLNGTKVTNERVARYTFSGIALYRPDLFKLAPETERFPLAPLLRDAVEKGLVTGSVYLGEWRDIGTKARLSELRGAPTRRLRAKV
ncbi:MAG: nucleotidyltransferase family protein [Gammaproteobacteria bacterium]|nr:nucleotidyltransferase family protein [Gammaproteobacteria bacterium]